MANIIKDPSLPKHWVKKTSRRCPTATYYFNVKTGKSTWMHPTFLEQSMKGTLPELPNEKGTSKDLIDSSDKPKITSENQVSSSTGLSSFQEIDTTRESKDKGLSSSRESVKFVLKSKTFGEGVDKESKGSPKPKRDVPIHPMLIRARKIAEKSGFVDKPKVKVTKIPERKADSETKREEPVSSLDRKIVKALRSIKDESVNVEDLKSEKEEKEDKVEKNKVEPHKSEELKEFEKSERKIIKARRKLLASRKPKTFKDAKEAPSKDDKKQETKNTAVKEQTFVSSKRYLPKKKSKDETYPVTDLEIITTTPSRNREGADPSIIKSTLRYKCKDDKTKFTRSIVSLLSSDEESPADSTLAKPISCRRGNLRKKDKNQSSSNTEENAHSTPRVEVKYLYDKPHEIRQTEKDDFDEVVCMEVEEQEIISEIANFRGTVSHSVERPERTQFLTSRIKSSSTALYIVVDTNVLIRDKQFLDSLRGRKIDGQDVVIVIPYTALQEMDGLKKNKSIGKACLSAMAWCNSHFQAKDPRVQGQSYENYMDTLAKNPNASGDDLIRDCCLFLKKDGLNICLLSNDINLRNKALMSNFSSVGVRDLKHKLQEDSCNVSKGEGDYLQTTGIPDNNEQVMSSSQDLETPMERDLTSTGTCIYEKQAKPRSRSPKCLLSQENARLLGNLTESLHYTLGHILEHVMVEAYGDLWLSIVVHKPPWSLDEIFMCWNKHWIAVMTERFPRELQNLIRKIRLTLKARIDGEQDIKILRKYVTMLYNFFRREPYKQFVSSFVPKTEKKPSDTISTKEAICEYSPDAIMKEATTPPRIGEDNVIPVLSENPEGLNNVLEMVNRVGVHITHFTALILDAYGKSHTLSKLDTTATMSQDGAHSSAINLHNVVMRLGMTIVRCVNETTPESVQEFGQVLIDFWAEAKEPCPNLPFTGDDIVQTIASPNGLQFLQMTIQELEKLINMLKSVLDSG